MIADVLVTIVIRGAAVMGSTPARLHDGIVVAPLAPYLRDVAERITLDSDGRIALERAGRRVTLALGSPLMRDGSRVAVLPIAPYLRSAGPILPLAAVVRALGASATYDSASKTLAIDWTPAPIVAATPDASYVAPPEPLATFTQNPTPGPRVTVTGIPRPRRTPIPADGPT